MFEFGNDFNGPEADAYSVADGQEGEDAQHLVPPQREKTETQGKIEIEWKIRTFMQYANQPGGIKTTVVILLETYSSLMKESGCPTLHQFHNL